MKTKPGLFLQATLGPRELAGRNVTVMGLGLFGGGQGLVEALCRWGAKVTVTDLADETKLAKPLAALKGLPIQLILGRHREEDFTGADLVFANPAVPRDAPLLRLCRDRKVPVETEMNLFFKLCRGKICGITGSNGKTTTTRLAGDMFAAHLPRTLVGGNLGRSLVGEVESIGGDDWVVLELSSFQLEDLAVIDRRPDVSLVTNVSPNHLDRHGTYQRYLECKRVILEQGPERGWAILCGDDARVRSWGPVPGRRTCYYGRAGRERGWARGVWVLPDGRVVARGLLADEGKKPGVEGVVLFQRGDLQLRGDFNLINAAGAAAAALVAGVPPDKVRAAVVAFKTVPYRLELVHVLDGVEFFNDSIATTPESTICALDALGPRVILIAGGYDKGSAFHELGRAVARRALAAVLIGSTALQIRAAIAGGRPPRPVYREETLAGAVRKAFELAVPGDRVVLSPACASYDMFVNFEDRGDQFTRLVKELEPRPGT